MNSCYQWWSNLKWISSTSKAIITSLQSRSHSTVRVRRRLFCSIPSFFLLFSSSTFWRRSTTYWFRLRRLERTAAWKIRWKNLFWKIYLFFIIFGGFYSIWWIFNLNLINKQTIYILVDVGFQTATVYHIDCCAWFKG